MPELTSAKAGSVAQHRGGSNRILKKQPKYCRKQTEPQSV